MASKTPTDVGEPRSILRTHLDDSAVQDKRPSLERPSHFGDDDEGLTRGSECAQAGAYVRRARWREAPDAFEWIKFELEGDLRPPRAVLDRKADFELESTSRGDRLDVLQAHLPVAAFPSRDRRLTQPKPIR
jgi:hypothetical protein